MEPQSTQFSAEFFTYRSFVALTGRERRANVLA